MSSTYTTSLTLSKIVAGTESGTWGDVTNTNWQLIEDAVAGVVSISVSGSTGATLSVANGATDQSRNAVVVVTGALSVAVAIVAPLVKKVYVISNQTTGGFAITIGASSGAVVTIPNGVTTLVYCDGTNFNSGITGFAGGNLTITGNITASGTIAGSVFSGGAVTANLSGGAINKIHYQTGSSQTGFIDAPPSTGVPTFLSYNPATPGFTWSAASGTASNIIGGGTNTLVYQQTANNTQFLANPGTGSTFYLTYNNGLAWATGGSVTAVAASSPLTAATVGGTATVSLTGTVAIGNGGTNSTNTPTGGGVAYGTGSAYNFTVAGTTGYLLKSNGASAPSWIDPSTVSIGTATNATNVAITNTSAGGTYYPVISGNSSGNNGATTSSSNFTFNPGTGALSATTFSGNLAGNLTGSGTVSATATRASAVSASASDQTLATTIFVNAGNSLTGANGYQKFGTGLIINYGYVSTNGSGVATITFPQAFTLGTTYSLTVTPQYTAGVAATCYTFNPGSASVSCFNTTNAAAFSTTVQYIAIGY